MGRVELRRRWKVFGDVRSPWCSLARCPPWPIRQKVPFLGISELKLGALYHDAPGLWSGFSVERPTADANFEVLFAPWARTFGGYLRPAIGTSVNFIGGTSKAYADLRWEAETASGVFFATGHGSGNPQRRL